MIKHPRWRVPEIGLVYGLEQFKADLEWCVAAMPFYEAVADLEVVGSYASKSAKIYSDLDVNIAMRGEREQRMAIWEWSTFTAKKTLRERVDTLVATWGIRVDLACAEWENKLKNPTYSMREGRYCGEPGDVHSRWDWKVQDWVREPAKPKIFAIETDPYAAEVEEWAARYGESFIRA